MRKGRRWLCLLIAAAGTCCLVWAAWPGGHKEKRAPLDPAPRPDSRTGFENYTTLPGPYCKIKPPDRRYAHSGPGVCLGFDDHAVEAWYGLRDLFKRYGAKVTFGVSNPDVLGEGDWANLAQLQEDGHEIACHGYRHMDFGAYMIERQRRGDGLVSIIDAYLAEEILPAMEVMRRRGFAPVSFVHPYGARCGELDIALLSHFKVVRAITGLKDTRRGELCDLDKAFFAWDDQTEWPVHGTSMDLDSGWSAQDVLLALEKARETGSVLVLYGHAPEAEGTGGGPVFSLQTLDAVLAYVEEHDGFNFYRLMDLAPLRPDSDADPSIGQ